MDGGAGALRLLWSGQASVLCLYFVGIGISVLEWASLSLSAGLGEGGAGGGGPLFECVGGACAPDVSSMLDESEEVVCGRCVAGLGLRLGLICV